MIKKIKRYLRKKRYEVAKKKSEEMKMALIEYRRGLLNKEEIERGRTNEA